MLPLQEDTSCSAANPVLSRGPRTHPVAAFPTVILLPFLRRRTSHRELPMSLHSSKAALLTHKEALGLCPHHVRHTSLSLGVLFHNLLVAHVQGAWWTSVRQQLCRLPSLPTNSSFSQVTRHRDQLGPSPSPLPLHNTTPLSKQ